MLRFRNQIKLVLFLSSYVPLFLFLSIELSSFPPLLLSDVAIPVAGYQFDVSWASLITLAVSGTLYFALRSILKYHSGHRTTDERLDNLQQRNELVSSYLLVYVFVFTGLNFTNGGDWLIFILFFGILAVLQLNSEMLHVNPILGIWGYQLYEVQSKEKTFLVLSKSNITESIRIPESQRGETDPDYRNIKLIRLGSSTFMTARGEDANNEAESSTTISPINND